MSAVLHRVPWVAPRLGYQMRKQRAMALLIYTIRNLWHAFSRRATRPIPHIVSLVGCVDHYVKNPRAI